MEAGEPPPPAAEGSRHVGLMDRGGLLIPLSLILLGAPRYFQSPMNIYDGGLLLTLARFTDLSRVPYRDLWTLYGPGPPVLGSVVGQLFGPGLLASRISLLVTLGLMVAAVYAIAVRYVAWWWAAAFASAVATFGSHFHFRQTLVFLLWGIWFVLRADDQPEKATRRAAVGAFLIGMSFWGRFEFAAVGLVLVVGLWWHVRRRLPRAGARWVLVSGLVPLAAFGVFLLGVVGWERTYLNLIDYPFRDYPELYCRGVPDQWGNAARVLLAPLDGGFWTEDEMTLWAGTFLPPILGVLVAVSGARGWTERSFERFGHIAIGFSTLFIWLEHRPRASPEPHPNLPMIFICLSILAFLVGRTRPRVATGVCAGASSLVVLTILTSWLPPSIRSWGDWPPYHPLYGFARGEDNGLYNERVWSEVTQVVQRHAAPEEEIFVGLTNNASHFANAPLFYWLVDRPPASRFIEFDPCLTDTAPVQRDIVEDLADTDVIITTTFFPRPRPPILGPPPTILDQYLSRSFLQIYEGALGPDLSIFVLARRGSI